MERGSIEWLQKVLEASGVTQAEIAEFERKSTTWVSNVVLGKYDSEVARSIVFVAISKIRDAKSAAYERLAEQKRGE